MCECILDVNNLSKIYNKKTIIENISFKVFKKDIVAFVGNNGAGKTTTIKCILNEIKFNSGLIKYKENIIKNANQLNEIAFFPDLNSVPLDIKVIDYITYIAKINFVSKEIFKNRLLKIMALFNLKEFLDKKIKKLSSGEKKKIIFAGVLIKAPQFIILDEPTANLDVESRQELLDNLLKLNKMGITIMITSHILDELQNFATRLIIIDNKKIVYDDKFDNTNEKLLDIFKANTTKKKVQDINLLGDIYG